LLIDPCRLHPLSRPKHIHICQGRLLLKKASIRGISHRAGSSVKGYIKYCYRCNIWFSTLPEFQEHCEQHFMELDTFCGLVWHGSTYIIPARCPFCLSEQDHPWETCLWEFTTYRALNAHLSQHLVEDLNWEDPICSHPLCTAQKLASKDALLDHFRVTHGLLSKCMKSLYELSSKTGTFSGTAFPRPRAIGSHKRKATTIELDDIVNSSTELSCPSSPTGYTDLGACIPSNLSTKQRKQPRFDHSSSPLLICSPTPTDYSNLGACLPLELVTNNWL
jgi:hypothetical protein